MIRNLILGALLAGLCLSLGGVGLTQQPKKAAPKPAQKPAEKQAAPAEPKFEVPSHEQPFWDSAQAFLDAYMKRDAAAIGELFTKDAEFLDEFGELTVGRDDITQMFADVFDSSTEAAIEEIQIQRVRKISGNVALEEGVVIARDTADGPRHRSRYVALHTKQTDGKWLINTLKDFPREGGHRQEQLAQLSWLLGEWVNEDDESVVHTECRWSDDGNYLLRRFTVQTRDGREMSGVQRVGWDPALKKLRSWTFDSEGGFLTGVWTQDGSKWLLTSNGVNASGESVTGTAEYNVIDAEMITWHFRELIVGDEVRTTREPVTMVRRPPTPAGTSDK